MMSFYTGRDARLYEKKFKVLKKYFIMHDGIEDSNAAAFRHMVDVLYDAYKNNKK